MKDQIPRWTALTVLILVLGLIVGFATPDKAAANQAACNRTIVADVIALDQNYFLNRLGSLNNLGMIYALAEDVFPITGGVIGKTPCVGGGCQAGQVVLRPDKRPQPIALRVSKGDCLQINFTNLLNPVPIDPNEQNVTRDASAHVTGLPLVGSIDSDGSWVGKNASSLAAPGKQKIYTYYAQDENVYMITNMANTTGSEGAGGSLAFGLYGVVIVEPGIPGMPSAAAEYYRGHVTNEDMALAACKPAVLAGPNPSISCLDKANQNRTAADQPVINYDALYPDVQPFKDEGKAGRPILAMLQGTKLVHSDIHAVITGPKKGTFGIGSTYPSTSTNPRQDLPFREAASVFGDEQFNVQAFPFFFVNPVLKHTFAITKDGFVINYGGGAIGPEIVANRLAVGPMWDCPECKAEEFFLTSYAVGDPGMWVDVPANGCVQDLNNPLVNNISADPAVTPFVRPFAGLIPDGVNPVFCGGPQDLPGPGPKATVALYPDNPSNVHHSYIRDHFKFRNIHAGAFEHHIFHLHNNQWVFSPKSDKANYQDMQQIGPGGAYTMDLTNEGAGNRNANPGDAIYHCHFYPHFAQGMWSSLRMLDTFSEGTLLDPLLAADGTRAVWAQRDAPPAPGSRAYPDGELAMVDACVATDGTQSVPPCGQGTTLKKVCVGMCNGSPVPAVVPLPLYPMAPAPAAVAINPADPRRIIVEPNPITKEKNPGFPFYIMAANADRGAIAGHRPPSPPLDIACLVPLDANNECPNPLKNSLDGGLPRHIITGGEAEFVVNRFDISKELLAVEAEQVPEAGTAVEKDSFAFQQKRCHNTWTQTGNAAVEAICQGSNKQGKPFRGGYITNGAAKAVPGAPHSDPCVDSKGDMLVKGFTPTWNSPNCSLARADNPDGDNCNGFVLPEAVQFGVDSLRPYKISNIQIDLVLNKKGWHFPQQRIIALWGDIPDMYAGKLAPAPMVFRLNTLDCAEVWHSNLVPNFYELDDFQVRTPTDIIAQHSHMTKFDVASSDGAANLWNYEDGTMSPGEIVERIKAIKAGAWKPTATGPTVAQLIPKPHPTLDGIPQFAGSPQAAALGCGGATCGSRTTVQRWLADPVLDSTGKDRGIGNVFTHDHFGPSTFQQIGLYATILAEPAGSKWIHNETGAPLANRLGSPQTLTADGGPTSWQAQIIPPAGSSSYNPTPYREFYFENSDFQQAYKKTWDGFISDVSFLEAIARPSRDGDPLAIYVFAQDCPGPALPGGALPISPCPEAIGGSDQGFEIVNYRNESVGARVFDPVATKQAAGQAGDLSFAFASIRRADPDLNNVMQYYVRNTKQCPSCLATPGVGTCGDVGNPLGDPFCLNGLAAPLPTPTAAGIGAPIINVAATALSKDVGAFDPATPMMRVYEGDRVKIRMQVGATEESHHFSMHGAKWLMNYADPNSGWKNHQSMGISEQFQFDSAVLGDLLSVLPGFQPSTDYMYASNMSMSGLWTGEWGLMRSYNQLRADLKPLPNSIVGNKPAIVANRLDFDFLNGVCPKNAPVKRFNITAIMARDILPAVPGIVNPLGGATGGTLVYNSRDDVVPDNVIPADPAIGEPAFTVPGGAGPLHDPTAILYVNNADIAGLRAGTIAPEPLILRANAGDCVHVSLTNRLPNNVPDLNGITQTLEPIIDKCPNYDCRGIVDAAGAPFKPTFNNNDIRPSSHVGIHTQLLAFDPERDDGVNVGKNLTNTVGPGRTARYVWYAGDFTIAKVGNILGIPLVMLNPRPIEFGVVGLSPADKIKQVQKGMVGALVIEPKGQTCKPDAGTKAQASCTGPAGAYREFVAVTTGATNGYFASAPQGIFANNGFGFQPIPGFPTEDPQIGVADDAEDSGLKAFNYKSEPYWFRLKMAPGTPLNGPNGQQTFATAKLYSNAQVGGLDPETPIFTANNGEQFRFYLTMPAGNQRSHVPVIHGHAWQRTPHETVSGVESAKIALNPQSQVVGAQEGYGPAGHWNFIPEFPAGGPFGVAGDYLYRMQNPQGGFHGFMGLFRVE